MTRGLIAGLLLVACAVPVSASTPWILALPPLKEPSKTPAQESAPASARSTITGRLDSQAPIEQWQRAEMFEAPEACEDARMRHMREFSAAVERVGEDGLSSGDQTRLVTLARQAWGRCVPAFAFSEKQ